MGIDMKVRSSLQRKLDEARIKHAFKQAMTLTMLDLQKAAIKEAPKKTGNLRRSHSYEVRLGSDMIEGILKNSAPYWQYVNFGTSRMKNNPGQNFVGRAFDKVQPGKAFQKHFNSIYKN